MNWPCCSAQGASAKTTLAWYWLSEFITREHLAGSTGAIEPPIIARLNQFLSDGMIYYNHARKIMYIPYPFANAQLSAHYILVMVPSIPFLMDQYTNEVWLGAALTFFTVGCLTGLHEVARELENPFRNVPNEIPLCTLLAMYNESLVTLFSGYHPDAFWLPNNDESQDVARNEDTNTAASTATGASVNTSNDRREASVSNGSVEIELEKFKSASDLASLQDVVAQQAKQIEELRKLVKPNA
mmetsp:Transcript_33972/g.52111  ORF Transcript_33972/g.52111 Transcript_33972/m.52111 type:complete len:242 (-) Transcript_33972:57-782(-)